MAFGWLINDHDCDQAENQSSVSMKNASATEMENAEQTECSKIILTTFLYDRRERRKTTTATKTI